VQRLVPEAVRRNTQPLNAGGLWCSIEAASSSVILQPASLPFPPLPCGLSSRTPPRKIFFASIIKSREALVHQNRFAF
jgi:hypothetical protein